MKIIVCIKQVPGTAKVDIDETTGVLKRDGIDSKMNPYDLYALETALRLKEKHGGSIYVITMGPMQAAEIIRESFAMGADIGVILSDRAFAGADVLATAYTLSQGIHTLDGYDVIICGKQTTDGDTAQVGPEIAEYLDIPHIANVIEILEIKDREIRVKADMGDYIEICDMRLPCLITAEKDIHMPKLPSYKKMLASRNKEIKIITLADLPDTDPANYGLNGSPTRVERIFPPESRNKKIMLEGSGENVADKFYIKLEDFKFIPRRR